MQTEVYCKAMQPRSVPIIPNYTVYLKLNRSGQDDWDFGKAVDDQTQTFVVCLEILSGSEGRSGA